MAFKMNMMRYIYKGLVGSTVLAISLGIASAARADLTQFAAFSQGSGQTALPFRFVNTGSSTSKFGLLDNSGAELTSIVNGNSVTGVLVNFQYFQAGNGYGSAPGANIQAIMRMTADVQGTTTGGSGLSQDFQNIFISFTAVTPGPGGLTNLLTVSSGVPAINPGSPDPNKNGTNGSTGNLAGNVGGSTASVSATESAFGANYVGYSSDFLNFSQTFTNRNYNISLANVQEASTGIPVTRGPNTPPSANSSDYFRNFVASGAGTFGADPSPFIPEPGSLLLFAPVALAAGLVRRRKK